MCDDEAQAAARRRRLLVEGPTSRRLPADAEGAGHLGDRVLAPASTVGTSTGDRPASVVVRDTSTEDWPAVAGILARSFEEYATALPPSIWRTYREELVDIAGRADVSQLLAATVGDRLVGTVTLFPDATLDSHGWPPGTASFRLLAVDPDFRVRGVGRALVEECIERARRHGARLLGLHTAEVMAAGIALYRSLGFVAAPHLDFDPHAHYAGEAPTGDGETVRGVAYVLEL